MPFELDKILDEKINTANLRAYIIGYDFGRLLLNEFADVLMDGLVDFAFGFHTGILKQYDRRKLIEAAKSLYKIKGFEDAKKVYLDNQDVVSSDEEGKSEDLIKYEKEIIKKGEFGELILHVFLRDYYRTVPLISKIFFKDTDGFAVHGFDAVHIGPDPSNTAEPSLFLGESKIYFRKDGTSGECGVNDLADDIQNHFRRDFLKREFALVSKKKDSFKSESEIHDLNTKEQYEDFIKQKNDWYDKLHAISIGKGKLETLLNSVTVPVICTYESQLFKENVDILSKDFEESYKKEIKRLEGLFLKKIKGITEEPGEPVRSDLNVILIMLPIPSKKDLVSTLHSKVWRQSNA